ncbi:TonB family protein [Sulfurimonas sp. HSL3-7]|uniref:energy transducer TonB n=1 Tax=Sulfonitrofixus jiaomeiensis TaxID=3131938 RepID=UPI0031F7647B
MNRHVSSFLITLVLYLSVAGLIIYQSNDDNYCDKKSPDEHVGRVCFSVIDEQLPVQKHVPKEKKTDKRAEKKIEKRVEKKVTKRVEKRIEKKVEKAIPKKEPLPEPVPEAFEEEAAETIPEPTATQEIAKVEPEQAEHPANTEPKMEKAAETRIQKELDKELLQARQDRFLASLVERINRNKSYPKSARRRGIEGSVKVGFQLSSDGSVGNITLISGRKVFKKSAFEAIAKSFPIEVDSAIFDFPKEFKVTLAYVLK